MYNQNKHYALCIFNHREIIVTFRTNAAAQPSSPRSIYRPIHFADRSWTTTTLRREVFTDEHSMKASVVIVMQPRPRQRCRHEVQRCSGGLHAISESRPSQGHGRRSALLPPARWHNACPLKSVHSIRATIIEIATRHLDATIDRSVSCRRHSRFSNCTWQLFARMITGIISRFQSTWPWDYEPNLFLYWTPTVYH